MTSYCDQCTTEGLEDDSFIFDDTNAWPKKCSRHVAQILNEISTRNMDEQIDTLEDSPLLINEYYGEVGRDDFHCHNGIVQEEDKKAWKKLLSASVLCFLFMITELVGGYIAGSLAVMTDAAHLFSDFIGFLISLVSIWIARKPPSSSMTFGYHRTEVLGALLSVLTVWLLAAIFAVLAILRMWKSEYDINANTMMIVATLGLIVNFVMGAVLYGCCHNHSHGLSTANSAPHTSNINVRAAAAHVLGDLLQSCGVLIAAIIIKVFPNAGLADPICTLIFSIVIICTTAKVAKDSIWLLLEGSPRNNREIVLELQSLGNVRHVHNLHIWTLSPGKDVLSVHLSIERFCDRDLVLKEATNLIKSKLNIISCTVQIETYNPEIINSCKSCRSINC